MNICCMFLVGALLVSGVHSVAAAQPLEVGYSGKKLNLSEVNKVGTPGVSKVKKGQGSQVRFALEHNTVHEITPRQQQEKEKRKRFDVSQSAVPQEIRDDAAMALAVLVTAKASGDSRQRRAALDICTEVRDQANAVAAALNCKNPIKRHGAIRRKNKSVKD